MHTAALPNHGQNQVSPPFCDMFDSYPLLWSAARKEQMSLECSQTSLQTFHFTIRTSSTKSGFAFCPKILQFVRRNLSSTSVRPNFMFSPNGTGLTSYDHPLGTASSQQPHPEMEEAPLLLERVLITSGTV